MIDLDQRVSLAPTIGNADDYAAAVGAEQDLACAWLAGAGGSTWRVPDGLRAKVEAGGTLNPFFGDTVVLPIAGPAATELDALTQRLHQKLASVLAMPLESRHCHLTVHDLVAGPDAAGIESAMTANQRVVGTLFEQLGDYFAARPRDAVATVLPMRVYVCCNVSIVLGFRPIDEISYRRIMNLNRLFDRVVKVEHWPRLHVTLAYLVPVAPDPAAVAAIGEAIRTLPIVPTPIDFDLRTLAYQRFTSMNNYETLLTAGAPA